MKRTVFSIRLQYFHNVSDKIWKLFVELDFFLIVSNSLSLPSRFMRNTLDIRLHDADIVVEQVNALP